MFAIGFKECRPISKLQEAQDGYSLINDVFRFCALWYISHYVTYLNCSKINKNNRKLVDLREKALEKTNEVTMNSRAECQSLQGQVSPVKRTNS